MFWLMMRLFTRNTNFLPTIFEVMVDIFEVANTHLVYDGKFSIVIRGISVTQTCNINTK